MTAILQLWPFVLGASVGAVVPRRRGLAERIGLALIAVLAIALIRGMWPSDGAMLLPERALEWPHLLNVIVLLPIFGAVALLFMPRQTPGLLRAFTMGVLLLDLVASLLLLRAPMTAGWHFQYIAPWIPALGIRYHVAIDGISLWMVLLSTFTTPIAAYVAFGSVQHRIKDLCFAILLLHGAMIGAFISLDLFLFYLFWELMLVPMVIFIGIWGGADKIKAAYKFLLYTMGGSVLMLAAILYMVGVHKSLAGYASFDYLALRQLDLPRTAAWLCFGAFALAFAIKVPMWPVHTWLPDAHVQAPTAGSIILAAVLLKLGAYGYIRFCMGLFAGPAWEMAPTLAGVAWVGGILYGALVAWKQSDVKRLVAYSSVAHMGYVMLGIFAATQGSMTGAVLQMINHGVSTGALFLLVGVIYDRRHTRLVTEFGGLAKVMPVYAAVFVVITLSSIGVPGTNGFVGEFMVIMGTFVSPALGAYAQLAAIGASLGVILAAVYMLSVVQRVFFGPVTKEENRHLPDLNVRETLALAPLLVMVFVIGLFPRLFLQPMEASVASVLEGYRDGRIAYQLMDPETTTPGLRPHRGGPSEIGYPEDPNASPPPAPGAAAEAAVPAPEPGAPPPAPAAPIAPGAEP